MWCDYCQQEVPGVATPDGEESIVCARCGEELMLDADPSQAAEPAAEPTDEAGAAGAAGLQHAAEFDEFEVEDWVIDDQLADARRLVSLARPQAEEAELPHPSGHEAVQWRPDPPHAAAFEMRPGGRKRRPHRPSLVAWALLSLGLMAFVCGGVLLGWSFLSGRGELWSLGLPLVLAGQAGLVLGLIFQLDGLWRTNRDTSASLDELDEQITDLRTATTLLGTTHSSGARSFYAHIAEGASPQMLLSDLKGQLDMLALRMDQRKR